MKKRRRMRGKVEQVIKPLIPGGKEKAQIEVEGADHLYREIRIDNEVLDGKGQRAALKPGAEVDVVIEADSDATMKKPS
ncbi:MAG TPA: hypothetical protein VM715_13765 [Candidatus Acidoferrum sp.]|jgi:hypothetical protein|nr:hypothetical protein [Candidatus Acidoferrum sp.]